MSMSIVNAEKLLCDMNRSLGEPLIKGTNVKVGQVIEGTVMDIEAYGVFVANYELQISGLIHKSKVGKDSQGKERGFFSDAFDLGRYFKVGDQIQVKIAGVRMGNKIELTTDGIDLPIYDLGPREPYVPQGLNSVNRVLAPLLTEIQTVEQKSELDEITEMLRSKIGAVSHKAHIKLAELMRKHGVVRLAVSTMRSVEEFKPVDQSLLMVELIEKHVGVQLPKFVFHITAHAQERWAERGNGTDLLTRIKAATILFDDELGKRRVYGDGQFIYPCSINDKGENMVKTVTEL